MVLPPGEFNSMMPEQSSFFIAPDGSTKQTHSSKRNEN